MTVVQSPIGEPSVERELLRIQREKQKRLNTFNNYDKMLQSEDFGDYLDDRQLDLISVSPMPQYSLEMEQCALGAMMMLDAEAVTDGMKRLHVRLFHVAHHRTICGAILHLASPHYRRANPGLVHIDYPAVADVLASRGLLGQGIRPEPKSAQQVPPDYLPLLIDSTSCAANIDHYINKVIWWSQRRHMELLGRETARRSCEPDLDPTRTAVFIQNAAQAIRERGWCDFDQEWERTK